MKELPQGVDRDGLFQYLLGLGDDRLIQGHRLSEWCGHAPILEEDIALANVALDCLGQAAALLALAADIEGKGRTADDLAYFREGIDFRNCLLVEQPKGDFAFTIARQFLFDVNAFHFYRELSASSFGALAGIAGKAFKETCYHLRHSRQWMLRMGDGTEESQRRLQTAIDELWRFTGELFLAEPEERELTALGVAPDRSRIEEPWREFVEGVFREAKLGYPTDQHMVTGGRRGRHTEHLGHLLAEMQIVARSFPEAKW